MCSAEREKHAPVDTRRYMFKMKKIHRRKTIRKVWNLIENRNFELSEKDIKNLQKYKNKRISATIEIYKCYAFPEERDGILMKCLRSKNQRKREYACDLIGDEYISAFKEELEKLLQDPIEDVRDSAKVNLNIIKSI